jgi:hypothetical protein
VQNEHWGTENSAPKVKEETVNYQQRKNINKS